MSRAEVWKFLEVNILPYIIDWLFILVLGILMACLSFALDFFISKISLGNSLAVVISTSLLYLLLIGWYVCMVCTGYVCVWCSQGVCMVYTWCKCMVYTWCKCMVYTWCIYVPLYIRKFLSAIQKMFHVAKFLWK